MSKFVSAGTIDEPVERDDEWLTAQKEIEAKRQREAELAEQQGGKSLFEVLQANKAAKQEAFEESIRLKNQFRSLDDDEVEFLDSVLESTRAKEAAVRKETSDQLESFRKQQEEAERAAVTEGQANSPTEEQESWTFSGKKRKKARDKDGLPGVKLRKMSSSTSEKLDVDKAALPSESKAGTSSKMGLAKELSQKSKPLSPDSSTAVKNDNTISKAAKQASPPVLGLGDYSSSEDD